MPEARRIALYGGSFDPPHVAHVLAAAWALTACPIDRVWVLPVAYHAFGKPLSPFPARLAMCRLAFSCFGRRVRVCPVERHLGPVNRTIDTVRHLQARYPQHAFSLLVGSDLWADRDQWKDFEALRAMLPFWTAGRAGVVPPAGVFCGPELPAVASHVVRARIAHGESVAGLVPEAVVAYVRDHGLYGPAAS